MAGWPLVAQDVVPMSVWTTTQWVCYFLGCFTIGVGISFLGIERFELRLAVILITTGLWATLLQLS